MPNAAFLTPHAVTGVGVGPCTCSQSQWEQGGRQGRAPRCRRTKHRPAAWRERTEGAFKSSGEGEHRKLFGCNLEGKEPPPVLWGLNTSSLLGQGEVPFGWAEPELIQISSSIGAGTHSGMFPPGSLAQTPTCSFQPHLWQLSQLLRRCGHRRFSWLKLVAELRDGAL